jgi:hypothetical protein
MNRCHFPASLSRRTMLVAASPVVPAMALMVIWGCDRTVPPPSFASLSAVAPLSTAAHGDDSADDTNWVEFHESDSDFTAAFPVGLKPKRLDDTVPTPIGSQRVVRFQARQGSVAFDAGYLIRTPHPLAALAGEGRILESACDGTARSLGGRVVATTSSKVDGHASRDIEIDLPADEQHSHGRHASARLIITDTRIYHAIICNDAGAEPAPDASRFKQALQPG